MKLLSTVIKEGASGPIKAEIFQEDEKYVVVYSYQDEELETLNYDMEKNTLQQTYRLVEQKLHSIRPLNG